MIDPALRPLHLVLVGEEEPLDATLSALRRRHRGDALEQLARWRPSRWSADRTGRQSRFVSAEQIELGLWICCECRLHVEADRFEHAIALIERYRPQPLPVFKESP